MGQIPDSNIQRIPGPNAVVAPYATIFTTSTVRYTYFTATDLFQMGLVSDFIEDQTGESFEGTRMMVVEWNAGYDYVSVVHEFVRNN